ncbi:MAG: hypothetical protein ABTQ31_12720 [Rhizobiaceae bacterium]
MRRFLSFLALTVAGSALGDIAAAERLESVYTDLNADRDCAVFSMNEEGGEFANMVCAGWRGYPVFIFSGDLRETVFYGFMPDPAKPPAWESFTAFNSTGPKVEWRIGTAESRAVPVATIHRWFVNDDPEQPSKATEVLAVAKVGQVDRRDGCVVGLVLATGNPQANAQARRIADERAEKFRCGRDERVLVGSRLPSFSRSE